MSAERATVLFASHTDGEPPTVTLSWEKKAVYGQFPSGRGYHTAIMHDSRVFVMGGYNGTTVFDDIWCLELAASAYLPQVVSVRCRFANRPLPSNAGATCCTDGIRDRRNFPK
jgi:hypothetical protein